MSSFFTRNGDSGYTRLPGSLRVSKADPRIEAIGCLDEVNSVLGFARIHCANPESQSIILHVQKQLYKVMAEIAKPSTQESPDSIDDDHIRWIEDQILSLEEKTKMPQTFIVPGDSKAGAALDMARTGTRRAERTLVAFFQPDNGAHEVILRFMNRLSSLWFILELYENQCSGVTQPTLIKDIE